MCWDDLLYDSAKNWQNRMISDKDITKTKKTTLLKHNAIMTWFFCRVRMMFVAIPNSVVSCVISASVVSGGKPRR